VGKAALAMVEEVRKQFREIPGLMEGTAKPDYKRCVEILDGASLQEMVPPGALVMLSPVVVGVLFGDHHPRRTPRWYAAVLYDPTHLCTALYDTVLPAV